MFTTSCCCCKNTTSAKEFGKCEGQVQAKAFTIKNCVISIL